MAGLRNGQGSLDRFQIAHLTDHLKENHKDHHGRRGFLALIQRRRTLLEYLKGQEEQRYRDLIAKLGLRR
ncbi:30S ribosomal protein S15 [bacterium]|nr:30S ribosomal protein S15 [bacterium]